MKQMKNKKHTIHKTAHNWNNHIHMYTQLHETKTKPITTRTQKQNKQTWYNNKHININKNIWCKHWSTITGSATQNRDSMRHKYARGNTSTNEPQAIQKRTTYKYANIDTKLYTHTHTHTHQFAKKDYTKNTYYNIIII